MDQKYIDGLRQKYIKNPPEGMTPKLVRNMTDSDLLDMHYFLTEDDDLDGDGFEEGFYIDFFLPPSVSSCPLIAGIFHSRVLQTENFPLIKKSL